MDEVEKLAKEIISTFGIKADGKTRPLATPDHLARFVHCVIEKKFVYTD